MDLRQLRCFAVLAEELNFGRAARRLNVAQPAVSQQIARLEADLDVSLFDRNRSSVHLTEAGKALHTDARRILDLVDVATANVRNQDVYKRQVVTMRSDRRCCELRQT